MFARLESGDFHKATRLRNALGGVSEALGENTDLYDGRFLIEIAEATPPRPPNFLLQCPLGQHLLPRVGIYSDLRLPFRLWPRQEREFAGIPAAAAADSHGTATASSKDLRADSHHDQECVVFLDRPNAA